MSHGSTRGLRLQPRLLRTAAIWDCLRPKGSFDSSLQHPSKHKPGACWGPRLRSSLRMIGNKRVPRSLRNLHLRLLNCPASGRYLGDSSTAAYNRVTVGKSGFLPVYWTDNRMSQSNAKTLLLLKPRGFCAGVVRAIDIVRIALENFG